MFSLSQFILLVGIIEYAVCSCPDGWLRHGTSCYHFSHEQEQWNNAFQICQILGGSLLEINDATENAYITGQLSSHGGSSKFEPFMALTDLAEENVWKWMVSHTKLDASSFTNWASGEPNNHSSNGEDCVNILESGKWNDAECNSSRFYICERLDEDGISVIG